jgi:hypothetical protein
MGNFDLEDAYKNVPVPFPCRPYSFPVSTVSFPVSTVPVEASHPTSPSQLSTECGGRVLRTGDKLSLLSAILSTVCGASEYFRAKVNYLSAFVLLNQLFAFSLFSRST